jgi:hypothetical protein
MSLQATALRRSDEERSRWAGFGGAVGCAAGLLAMLLAIVTVSKL